MAHSTFIAYTMLQTGRNDKELGGRDLDQINPSRLQRYFTESLGKHGSRDRPEPDLTRNDNISPRIGLA